MVRGPAHDEVVRRALLRQRGIVDASSATTVDRAGGPGRSGAAAPRQAPPAKPTPVVCLSDACLRRLADMLEERWLTTRGLNVRAPSTCMQPTGADDVNRITVNQALPGATGSELVLVEIDVPENYQAVVKGIGWIAALAPGAPSIDPYTEVEFSVRINGQEHPEHARIRTPITMDLAALASVQILVPSGGRFELVARHYAGASTTIRVSARAIGWQYVPVAQTDGVLGSIAY